VRYWDDMKAGEVVELGSHTMDKERMLSFAREFDPQPFHTDEKAAEASIWGGLIASGWHTGSTLMRLFYDGFLKDTASLGSPASMRPRNSPVRRATRSTARLTVTEATASRRPNRGSSAGDGDEGPGGEVVATTSGGVSSPAAAWVPGSPGPAAVGVPEPLHRHQHSMTMSIGDLNWTPERPPAPATEASCCGSRRPKTSERQWASQESRGRRRLEFL
jgi:acyl dehydratase